MHDNACRIILLGHLCRGTLCKRKTWTLALSSFLGEPGSFFVIANDPLSARIVLLGACVRD